MARGVNPLQKDKVLYLYGITQGLAKHNKIVGVDGKAVVEGIDCESLICWVSRVPKSEFADGLSANMENLDWLAAMGTRHQEAVSAISQMSDVLPARFGTVFLTESSLRADVRKRQSEMLTDFKRIQGCEEWGVKVFAAASGKVKLPATLRTGKDYLKAKSAILQSRARKTPDGEIDNFAQALEKVSESCAEGGRISGGRRDLLFQVSLLLKRGNRKKFETVLKRFSTGWKDTRQIECSGPWPPYSFVSRSIQ
jgi:hypothetical protein